MLKNVLSGVLISALSFLTCFAQIAPESPEAAGTPAKLTRADFYKAEPFKFNFEKETYKLQTKKSNFSGGAKTALWIGLFAAGVVTVVFLATRDKKESSNSPCGIGVTTPCPPGCVCIQ